MNIIFLASSAGEELSSASEIITRNRNARNRQDSPDIFRCLARALRPNIERANRVSSDVLKERPVIEIKKQTTEAKKTKRSRFVSIVDIIIDGRHK